MPTVTVSPRLIIHYNDPNPTGSPGVLLIHGLGATGESWNLQVPRLIQAGFRPITPDVRGFGKSSYPGGKNSISIMSSDLVFLLKYLETGPVYVVGISLGGTIALQLALDYPDQVAKLVLINTFASLRPDKLGVWVYFAFRFLLVHTLGLPTQARAVARRIFPRDDQESLRKLLIEQVIQSNPRGYRATMRALGVFNVTSRLKEIHTPTLIITGDSDTTVPPRNQQVLVKGIPNARQITVSGAGHALTIEKSEEFNKFLLDFLHT